MMSAGARDMRGRKQSRILGNMMISLDEKVLTCHEASVIPLHLQGEVAIIIFCLQVFADEFTWRKPLQKHI